MKQFNFKKDYLKHISKMSKKIQIKAGESLIKYKNGEYDKSLNLHRLTGDMKKYWTINVTGDIRILLDPKTGEIVDVIDIGNHNNFYK